MFELVLSPSAWEAERWEEDIKRNAKSGYNDKSRLEGKQQIRKFLRWNISSRTCQWVVNS